MKANKRYGKRFFFIGIIFTSAMLILLCLTPSKSSEFFVLNYTFQRFISILTIAIFLLILITALIFSDKRLINKLFKGLMTSRASFCLFVFATLISLIVMGGTLFKIFGERNIIFERSFPILLLGFLFSSEIIIFQILTSKGEITRSVWHSLTSFDSTFEMPSSGTFSETREKKIYWLVLIIIVAFFLAVAVFYYRGVYLAAPYPNNTFLFLPRIRFSDFFTVVHESVGLNPYQGFSSGQYPFLLIIGFIFSLIPETYSYFVYSLFFSMTLFCFSLYFLRTKTRLFSLLAAFTISFLTYPFLFTIDRGNFESLVFLFLLIFLFFYSQKRYLPAAIFLACAIALKVYPAIFLLLFLKEKKIKEIIITLGTTLGLSFLSLLCFKGGLLANLQYLANFSNISSNPYFLSFISITDSSRLQRGVSLMTLFKIVFQQNRLLLPEVILQNFQLIYLLFVSFIFIPVVFFIIYIEKVFWKSAALLTFAMLLLPNISADYKLLHVLLPLLLFLNSKEAGKLDYFYLMMFGLLLVPKGYYYLSGIRSDAAAYDISIAVPVNICILLITSLVIMKNGLVKWKAQKKIAKLVQTKTAPGNASNL